MNTLKKRKSGKKGFTLMEMLIVVAIIGILIAIAIPTFNNALTKARISADEANLRSYYAEVVTKHMLDDGNGTATLDAAVTAADAKKSTVKIDGQDYTLQAGTYTVAKTEDGESIVITYTPNRGGEKTPVKIPGGTVSGGTTGGSTEKP